MTKTIKILSLLLFFITIPFSMFAIYAADTDTVSEKLSSDAAYSGYDYVLDSYDINIVVNENNTFNITEKIGAFFNVPKHGIYRKIPLKNKVIRQDGTISYNRAKVSDISADNGYTASTANGYRVLQIGDADRTITGPKYYNISYLYDIGRDTGKGYDEFYYDLIGGEWDTVIGNITFTITMPKEFDENMLGFSHGAYGSTDSSGVSYKVDGNVITGSYSGIIGPGESVTMRLELPDGYFVNTGNDLDLLMILSFVIPILFLLITVFMWVRYGKDGPVTETVEFYPPEGFNSAETGFLYSGKADKKDVISLLVYLANKGYLKISETEEHSLFLKSKSFKLTKLKDYDGDDENERIFLAGLFGTSVGATGNTVASGDLYNNFYTTLNTIVANLNKKENRQKIFEKSSLSKRIFIILMIAISYVMITYKPVAEYNDISVLPFALLFPGVGFTVLFGMVFGKTKPQVKIFGLVWGLGFGGFPWAVMVLPSLLADPVYLAAYITGLVCVFIMVMFIKVMPKRTVYGNEMLGKIKGFRTFLDTAEKQKLEELVSEDPEYFYNILPYTYVLGVTDKWIKKFEVIAVQAPGWYDSSTAFNMAAFGSFMNSTMSAASSAMTSSPSGSGGGSSGGGSSGGGSGGGGGGSW
jgi:uncharacterized membrane protein YgcG